MLPYFSSAAPCGDVLRSGILTTLAMLAMLAILDSAAPGAVYVFGVLTLLTLLLLYLLSTALYRDAVHLRAGAWLRVAVQP